MLSSPITRQILIIINFSFFIFFSHMFDVALANGIQNSLQKCSEKSENRRNDWKIEKRMHQSLVFESIQMESFRFVDHKFVSPFHRPLFVTPPSAKNSQFTSYTYFLYDFFLYLVLDSSWNTCSFKKKKKRPKLFVVKSWMILSSSTLHSRVIN